MVCEDRSRGRPTGRSVNNSPAMEKRVHGHDEGNPLDAVLLLKVKKTPGPRGRGSTAGFSSFFDRAASRSNAADVDTTVLRSTGVGTGSPAGGSSEPPARAALVHEGSLAVDLREAILEGTRHHASGVAQALRSTRENTYRSVVCRNSIQKHHCPVLLGLPRNSESGTRSRRAPSARRTTGGLVFLLGEQSPTELD